MTRYKRSIFLVDKKFQIRFSLIICSFIFISSMVYPFILLDVFSQLADSFPELSKNMGLVEEKLILFLALIQFIFIFFMFMFSIYLTHKIAGPLYKLKAHLHNISQGGPALPLTFRHGDYFHDVAEEVSLFLETVNDNQERDFQYLDEVSAYIENLSLVVTEDKKPVLNEIARRLLEIKSRYKKSV